LGNCHHVLGCSKSNRSKKCRCRWVYIVVNDKRCRRIIIIVRMANIVLLPPRMTELVNQYLPPNAGRQHYCTQQVLRTVVLGGLWRRNTKRSTLRSTSSLQTSFSFIRKLYPSVSLAVTVNYSEHCRLLRNSTTKTAKKWAATKKRFSCFFLPFLLLASSIPSSHHIDREGSSVLVRINGHDRKPCKSQHFGALPHERLNEKRIINTGDLGKRTNIQYISQGCFTM
jgi:hypothetical protein